MITSRTKLTSSLALKRVGFGGAILAILIMLWHVGDEVRSGRLPTPMALLATGAATVMSLFSISLNACETKAMRQSYQSASAGFKADLKVSVRSSVANLLPIPGSLINRSLWLKRCGLSVRQVTFISAVGFFFWIFVAVLTYLMWFASVALFVVTATLGLTRVLIGYRIRPNVVQSIRRKEEDSFGRRLGGLQVASVNNLLIVELSLVWTSCIKLITLMAFVGHSISLESAAALTAASILALFVNITPSGIGIREAILLAVGHTQGIRPLDLATAVSIDRFGALLAIATAAVLTQRTEPRTLSSQSP